MSVLKIIKRLLITIFTITCVELIANAILFCNSLLTSLIHLKSRNNTISTNVRLSTGDRKLLSDNGFNVTEDDVSSGYYGSVYKAYHRSTVTQKVQSVAIKAIDVRKYHKILSQINNIDNNDELATVFNNSLNILKKISHQRIVKIEKILETFVKNNEISRLFVVSEMAETNLNDFILHQKPNGLDDEDWARVWFRHICEAVDCLHNTYQVSHQNIKPENILLFTKTQMSENKIPYDIKLGDCGISMLFPNLSNVCTGRDTISVMSSPDTQFKNVMSSDIYSLAIVLVILLNGDSKKYLMTSRQLGVFAYFNDKTFADDIKDQSIKGLIEKMMSRYYDSRPNIRDVLQYEWLKLKN